MYGHLTQITKQNKVVLPVRAAMELAVSVSPRSSLNTKVFRALKKNSGIIFRKQWWNSVSRTQVVSKDWRIMMRARVNEERKLARALKNAA